MEKYKDTHYRSVIKAISWRVFATITTITIVYVFTGKLVLSLGVGAVEVVVKLILYYFHERVWSFFGFGKRKHPLSGLPIKDMLKKEDYDFIKAKLKGLGYLEE